ncbi:MAG: helix-turn-helix transcriptional regulator [Chitinispirillia bacterium]|nr:helix-turn-helix transcriptional regulator [Chitinispirillia bacterium]
MPVNNLRPSAKKIDLIIAEKEMLQDEVCKKAGISQQTLCTIRRTERASLATIGKIARALGVSVTEIIFDEN